MALQNRVTPFGDIVAVPARGRLMGNRGIIHDPTSKRLLTRRWQHQAWICCVLSYKDCQHPIMGPGAYTELFFLDEATALAAGHRPCAYCRRASFNSFKSNWIKGNGLDPEVFVPVRNIDRQLHHERVNRRREKVTYDASIDQLPNGAMIVQRNSAMLLWEDKMFPWTPDGFAPPLPKPTGIMSIVLTPRSTVAAIRAGYAPVVGVDKMVG